MIIDDLNSHYPARGSSCKTWQLSIERSVVPTMSWRNEATGPRRTCRCGANGSHCSQNRDEPGIRLWGTRYTRQSEAGIVHGCDVVLGARENDINATVRSWMILGLGCGVNDAKPSVQGLAWNLRDCEVMHWAGANDVYPTVRSRTSLGLGCGANGTPADFATSYSRKRTRRTRGTTTTSECGEREVMMTTTSTVTRVTGLTKTRTMHNWRTRNVNPSCRRRWTIWAKRFHTAGLRTPGRETTCVSGVETTLSRIAVTNGAKCCHLWEVEACTGMGIAGIPRKSRGAGS